MILLSEAIAVRRRYVRSVNLERDLHLAGSLDGYTLTPRAVTTLQRFVAAHDLPHAACAWTITGVYGSGKSAFAHFLACLCGPKDSPLRQEATGLLRRAEETRSVATWFQSHIPSDGLLRAVVSASRESAAHAVLRGVAAGAEAFWASKRGSRPEALKRVRLMESLSSDGRHISEQEIVDVVRDLAKASGHGVLLIIDELGKVLEDAGRSGGSSDLMLLQLLAEMSAASARPLRIVGLLHQSFSEYGSALGTIERNEWDKVQGRFEDVPFTGPTEEMLYLVGRAIERNAPGAVSAQIGEAAKRWESHLRRSLPHLHAIRILDSTLIDALYPLHPIAALALPSLCARYAQHDRSLFTFLTSNEPYSLRSFLAESQASPESLPLLPLHQVYDYFVHALAGGSPGRPHFQRWAEIHGVVSDARSLTAEELAALKAIGTLNLIASTGPLRASRGLVTAALLTSPKESPERWHKVLERLVAQRLVTYRTQVDEYRIWEGSDFDVDSVTRAQLAAEKRSLAVVLTEVASLSPLVAQRHSYQKGTLRYFERRFLDQEEVLGSIRCGTAADGIIVYWAAENPPANVPTKTADGKPLIVALLDEPGALRSAVLELAALRAVERSAQPLQTDGVARREVRSRMRLAQGILDSALRIALDPDNLLKLWVEGRKESPTRFHAALSDLCDKVYSKTPTLWNELINRRELTSQGARAQRELIEALVRHPDQERFGLKGDGPALSMYASLFQNTGIHRKNGERWIIAPPTKSGVRDLWKTIESFCLESRDRPRPLDGLYEILEAPPFGVKRGMIPIFIAAVLVLHDEDIAAYREGTFIPVLGPEHFELLVRQPALFSVKHIALGGLRQEFFRDLELVIQGAEDSRPGKTRNATLLAAVRPLLRFATSLPKVTRQTEQLSHEACDVRAALLSATEPDTLLFEALPQACGHGGIAVRKKGDYVGFLQNLKAALRELSMHYDALLDRCRLRIHDAFGIKSQLAGLREDLRVRSSYLLGQCLEPRLRSFIQSASSSDGSQREWLESLVMIVSDRPLESWSDADALSFEANLGDMARRFANLEALQKEAARNHAPGYEARRITITRSDGVELSDLVWVDADQSTALEPQVARLLEQINSVSPEHQRHALAVTVLERLLDGRQSVAESVGAKSPAEKVCS